MLSPGAFIVKNEIIAGGLFLYQFEREPGNGILFCKKIVWLQGPLAENDFDIGGQFRMAAEGSI